MIEKRSGLSFSATVVEAGRRLDTVIAGRVPALSRSYAGRLIRAGCVSVNHLPRKPGYAIKCGDIVQAEIPPPEPIDCTPEPIPLSVLHEDGHIIVLNKPSGLVVHPGPGHRTGTLVNALLYHCRDLAGIGGELRPGIVHRLDKNTSGTIVVAKSDMAHESLCSQFKNRQVQKRYLALVYGKMKASAGVIDLPIGRHPLDRKKMSTRSRRTRSTETRWRIKETFHGATLIDVDLKTGRTHQIRVHSAALGHPVVGDATYGGKRRWKEVHSRDVQHILCSVKRQMLHAWQIAFQHPDTQQPVCFESPVPEDMASVIESLRGLSS
ncbi:MAG: RluA family pseudouridine synthase [Thermodesulfobacteriota bacterium]|nr:RluA family pseudouridine synthase [Thermodesulfobacteriota bacterium]